MEGSSSGSHRVGKGDGDCHCCEVVRRGKPDLMTLPPEKPVTVIPRPHKARMA